MRGPASPGVTRALRVRARGGPAVLADGGRGDRPRPAGEPARGRRGRRARGRDERVDDAPKRVRSRPRHASRAPPRPRRRSAEPGSGSSRCPVTTSRAPRCSCAGSSRAPSSWCRVSSSIDGVRRGIRIARHVPRVHLARSRAARPPRRRGQDDQVAAALTAYDGCSSAGRPLAQPIPARADAAGVRVARTTARVRRRADASTTARPSTARAAHRRRRAWSCGPEPGRGYLDDPERTAGGVPTDVTAPAGTYGRPRRAHPRRQAADGGRADDVLISGGVKVVARRGRARGAGGAGFARGGRRARCPTPSGASAQRSVAGHGAAAASDALATLRRRPMPRGSRPPPGPCASSSSIGCRCSPRAARPPRPRGPGARRRPA